jgi:hypothetical protein
MTENEYQQAFLKRAIEMIKEIQKLSEEKDQGVNVIFKLRALEGYLTGGLEIFSQLNKMVED